MKRLSLSVLLLLRFASLASAGYIQIGTPNSWAQKPWCGY
jgi:hypothetical protein